MLKHSIKFSKPIKVSDSECTFKLVASIQLDVTKELLKAIDKYVKSYTHTIKCRLIDNTLQVQVITKTKCASNDNPDKIKGVRLAESKAKVKLYVLLRRLAAFISIYYSRISTDYRKDSVRYIKLYHKEAKHIEQLDEFVKV